MQGILLFPAEGEIYGVAPDATYDPSLELFYDVCELPTVELAAINQTVKVPAVMVDVEVER